MTLTNRNFITLAAILALILSVGPWAAVQAQEPLTLQLNDAEGRPGRVFALVLRTYASRQLGQGQVDARATQTLLVEEGAGASELLSDPLGALVFSDADDATSRLRVDTSGPDPIMTLLFSSPSATVNQSDGPLAVMYFRLPQTALPGTEIDVVVDPLESFLIDHLGQPVPIAVSAGRLRVLDPADRFSVSAGAEETVPGEPAILSMQTSEVQRLSAGQAAFRFNPTFFEGAAEVNIDSRYGNATWVVDDSTPGLVIVTFESADGSLNFVPGDIVTLTLASRADIPPGSSTTIRLDRQLTFLINQQGRNLRLDIESDLLVFQ